MSRSGDKQAGFAFTAASDSPVDAKAPEALFEHEQLKYAANFETIAKARTVDALTNIWKLLAEGITAAEFEHRGYGQAIRSKARALILSAQRKSGNTAAGITTDALLAQYTSGGVLPPRPGQSTTPVAPVATVDEPKRKRSKKAAV